MIRVIVPAVQSSVGGGGGGILPSILGMGVAVAGGGLRKAMGGKGGRKGGGDGHGEASPDGAKPGAGRGLGRTAFRTRPETAESRRERTAAASTPNRWKAIPRATNRRTPATSHRERTARLATANRRERTAMAREARFHRHPDGASRQTRQAATGRRGRTATPAGSPARAPRTAPTARPLARARHSDALRRFG